LSVSVLDFYHALEYLYEFAEKAFPGDPLQKEKWCNLPKGLLLDFGVETVLDNISSTNASEKDKTKIINYYQNNKVRVIDFLKTPQLAKCA